MHFSAQYSNDAKTIVDRLTRDFGKGRLYDHKGKLILPDLSHQLVAGEYEYTLAPKGAKRLNKLIDFSCHLKACPILAYGRGTACNAMAVATL